MIDCGEGTQHRLSKSRVRINKVDHVFVSHLHGDHYFGLIGLISTMHLFGRNKELHIYAPSPIEEIIGLQLKHSETLLNFKIIYTFTDKLNDDLLFENNDVTVKKFMLNHGIFCTGFRFQEKPKKHRINKQKIPDKLSISDIAKLKMGEDILNEEGILLYANKDLTLPPKKSRSYAYCSDTKYDESILKYISDVDLLYHEATFANDMADRAASTYHSTAEQAAQMAIKANAKKLLLGHYSVRYRELDPIIEEARRVFKDSHLAVEGNIIDIEE